MGGRIYDINFPGVWSSYSSPPERVNDDVAFSTMIGRIQAANSINDSVSEILNRTCECNPSLKSQVLSEVKKLTEMNSELAEFLYQKQIIEELRNVG